MKNFVYDRYGYFNEEDKECFDYEGFHFGVERNDKSPQETENMNRYIIAFSADAFGKRGYIVPTRDDQLITLSEFGAVSLVAVEQFAIRIDDIKRIHYLTLSPDSKSRLSYVKNRWIAKLNLMQEKIMPSLKIDEYYYQMVMISLTQAIGLADNAIAYLEDTIIDYGDQLKVTALSHKRIHLNSYELLNPFNLIVDSPMRDFAELYKNGEIELDELISVLYEYHSNPKEVSILLSRVLYPTRLFDLIEDHYQKRGDITKEIEEYYRDTSRQIDKIKRLHNHLVNHYGIRKINWLI